MKLRSLLLRTLASGTTLRDAAVLKQQRFRAIPLSMLAISLCTLPANAGSVLFSDMGPTGNLYDNTTFWNVCGDLGCGSSTIADLFAVMGSGVQSVTEIDVAVGNVLPPDTFYASIWTDAGGVPGQQVANAFWSLATTTSVEDPCCSLVTVTGITGVNLTGGQQYFMILGPLSTSDSSWNGWFYNNQGVNGVVLNSADGGSTWVDANSSSSNPLGAFTILGTPEPGSLLLFGTGLLGIIGIRRYRV